MPIFSKTILASAVASMCLSAAVGGHIGFCAGKSLGIYSVPGEPACTTKYYQCNHGPDATLGECGADTRFWLRGGEGSWYYMCDHPDRVPACSAAVIDTFCDGKAAGSYARGEGDNTCTDKYWECDGSSDAATEMTCPADQVFDGSSCVGIETVMACPAITRGCAGVTTASDVPIADGNACSYEYYQCTGTSPVATKATCPDGQAFSGGMCMDRSMVADCVVTAGFCTANPSGMDFPDLSVPLALGAIDCSPNYLSCDGTNADPTVMSCGANEVPKFTRTGAGAFSVSCVAADSVCSVCAGPPGPPTQNPNNCREGLICISNQVNIIDCADIPSPVPLAWSDATGSCALIETVMTCPAITRACAGVTAMSKIVNPNAPACTVDYYQCDGTSPIATEESCATDEAFDVSTGTCVARASVSACAAVSPLGYCTGRGYAGVFPNPNQSDNKCSSSYWTCNWTGATDAIERSCPAGRVVHYNAAAPTWNFWCGPAPADC